MHLYGRPAEPGKQLHIVGAFVPKNLELSATFRLSHGRGRLRVGGTIRPDIALRLFHRSGGVRPILPGPEKRGCGLEGLSLYPRSPATHTGADETDQTLSGVEEREVGGRGGFQRPSCEIPGRRPNCRLDASDLVELSGFTLRLRCLTFKSEERETWTAGILAAFDREIRRVKRQPTVTFNSKQGRREATGAAVWQRSWRACFGTSSRGACRGLRFVAFRVSQRNVIGRVRTLQLESLILAQNERWRQA